MFPAWRLCSMRAALSHAYRVAAPELAADFRCTLTASPNA